MRVQSSEAIGKRSLVKLRDNFSLMFLNDCLKFSVGDIRKNIPGISADLSPARRENQGWGCFSPWAPTASRRVGDGRAGAHLRAGPGWDRPCPETPFLLLSDLGLGVQVGASGRQTCFLYEGNIISPALGWKSMQISLTVLFCEFLSYAKRPPPEIN